MDLDTAAKLEVLLQLQRKALVNSYTCEVNSKLNLVQIPYLDSEKEKNRYREEAQNQLGLAEQFRVQAKEVQRLLDELRV